MYEFSSTEKVIIFCFADFSIRANAKDLVLEKLNSLGFTLVSHSLFLGPGRGQVRTIYIYIYIYTFSIVT